MRLAGSATIIVAQATIDFPNLAAAGTQDSSAIQVPGAEIGDVVLLGAPAAAFVGAASFSAYVSAANAVKVRHTCATGASDPGSGVFTIGVIKNG